MRQSSRDTVSSRSREAETGSVSIALLVILLVLATATLSALGYAMLVRSKVALQLRLDRCIESRVQSALRIQNQIEASNLRMRIERTAAIAASVPTAGASLRAVKAALVVEQILQESLRAKWRAEQSAWIFRRGCDDQGDRFFPLPALRWWRPPDDPLGPLPLYWQTTKSPGGDDASLSIRIWKSNRFSQAEIFRVESSPGEKWRARWSPRAGGPRIGSARASLD